LQARHLAAGQPTPWMGAWERINIGGYLLWVLVLAVSLLRVETTPSATAAAAPSLSGVPSPHRCEGVMKVDICP
jgi:hypothetical protein